MWYPPTTAPSGFMKSWALSGRRSADAGTGSTEIVRNAQKSKLLGDLICQKFGEKVEILKTNSPLYVRCRFNISLSNDAFIGIAESVGIKLFPAEKSEEFPEIAFSVSSMSAAQFDDAVNTLYNAVFSCE